MKLEVEQFWLDIFPKKMATLKLIAISVKFQLNNFWNQKFETW